MIASRRWQDWASALLGVFIFISPFVFSTTSSTNASWTTFVIGIFVFLAAIALLAGQTYVFFEYAIGVLGVALFLSPWVMGFTAVASIAWTAWIVGLLLFFLAGTVLVPKFTGQRPATTT